MRDALLKKFPKAEWFEYEPVSDDNVREGTKDGRFGQELAAG